MYKILSFILPNSDPPPGPKKTDDRSTHKQKGLHSIMRHSQECPGRAHVLKARKKRLHRLIVVEYTFIPLYKN